ncbi:MAG: helix-turn-helix domain-containing protein, partial [Planctomycetaceae bacterium]
MRAWSARTKPACSPTNARLAQDLGCCEQTVRTALAHLQDAGWIGFLDSADKINLAVLLSGARAAQAENAPAIVRAHETQLAPLLGGNVIHHQGRLRRH